VIAVRAVSKVFQVPHERPRTLFHRLFGRGRTFEQFRALDDVSLDVAAGEYVALIGRNGSGKSTLLRLVAGIYPPSSGTVEVGAPTAPVLDLGVGFRGTLTVRDNVVLYGVLFGIPRRRLLEELETILEESGVLRFRDARLEALSTGLRARLAFTLALRAEAPILLVDEALSVGDGAFRKRCLKEFQDRRARGCTMLFVSHDLTLVEQLCDRAVVLEAGRVRGQGPPGPMVALYRSLESSAGASLRS
jgi:ABC-type polysaccharide/polyol phosphate transport system ATPase subunit